MPLRSFRVNNAPPPADALVSSGGSKLGDIGSAFLEGMSISAVIDVALRTVDGRTSEAASARAPTNSMRGSDVCNVHMKAFQNCVDSYGSDSKKCQFYMDLLTECRRKSGSMTNP